MSDKINLTTDERVKGHGWREMSAPSVFADIIKCRAFTKGSCRVLVSHEDHNGKMRWHLSISHPARYPKWEEIKDARYALLPLGLTFGMMLPPPNEYVNIHPNCFHLWEIEHAEW